MHISHINHSSLLIKTETTVVWTDPWVISTAFKNWTQDPYPFFSDIEKISKCSHQNQFILISHGHDDHLDDFLLASETFMHTCILIPKLNSPGLKNRILSLNPARKIIEVSSEPQQIGDLKVANFINPDFTGDDTIFVIEDSMSVFIHANDNWYKYSSTFASSIKSSLPLTKHLTYAVQLGIADCFPAAYNYSEEEKQEIIEKRYENYFAALKENSRSLGAAKTFTYANQSNIPAFNNSSFYTDFKKLFFANIHPYAHQLSPGEIINSLDGTVDADSKGFQGIDTLSKCLEIYEISAKRFIAERSNILSDFDFKFAVMGQMSESDVEGSDVTIGAYPEIWADILTGNSNIECITVGGSGRLWKPKGINISGLHHLLCKWTYRQQSEMQTYKFDYYLNRI